MSDTTCDMACMGVGFEDDTAVIPRTSTGRIERSKPKKQVSWGEISESTFVVEDDKSPFALEEQSSTSEVPAEVTSGDEALGNPSCEGDSEGEAEFMKWLVRMDRRRGHRGVSACLDSSSPIALAQPENSTLWRRRNDLGI
mmetsp:Transcript_51578/g.122700  ORF Transcript_51578/g.122700 Transcript_51578/m.122700 type:complete len:141 (+) Transcript_51578:157-579(+)